MRQRTLDAGVFVVLPILVLGLAPGAACDDGTVVENQDVPRIASMGRCPAADVGDEIAGDALVGPENEDALGVRRGKLAAAGGSSSTISISQRPRRSKRCGAGIPGQNHARLIWPPTICPQGANR